MYAKFHAKIIIFPGVMEEGHNPPHPWGAPKKPILNRVNVEHCVGEQNYLKFILSQKIITRTILSQLSYE